MNVMTDSTVDATPLKSSTSRNSNFTVQIQLKPKSPFEFVPCDAEESGFLDLGDFWDVAFTVESVMWVLRTPENKTYSRSAHNYE